MARGYGWELEQIKEMGEIELYQALRNLGKIQKHERLDKLNIHVLGTAAGMGDKNANRKVKKEMQEAKQESKQESQREIIRTGTAKKMDVPLLSAAEIMNLATNGEQKNG